MTKTEAMYISRTDLSRRTLNLRGFHTIRRIRLSDDESLFPVHGSRVYQKVSFGGRGSVDIHCKFDSGGCIIDTDLDQLWIGSTGSF